MFLPVEKQLEIIKRGAADIVSMEDLEAKLRRSHKEGRPLRIKFGADPTAPDIHIGHAVVIRKMKQFQDLGHTVIFIIGDFTGRIGDPSGKSQIRPQLSEEQVKANAKTYEDQIYKILDPEKTELAFNSSWLSALNFTDVVHLAAKYTVARMLERDEFKKRMEEGRSISIHEFLYCLAQAYDSVAVKADVELGGTDQTFNFLMARDIMREYGLEAQVALTMPLLEGTDGVQKMSKSLGNYIGIFDSPGEIYGKTMSIPDFIMGKWYELTTDVPMPEVRSIVEGVEKGTVHPRDAKMRLAREIVSIYHSAGAAQAAEEEFNRIFQKGDLPDEIPNVVIHASELRTGRSSLAATIEVKNASDPSTDANEIIEGGTIGAVRLLVLAGLALSGSEARRLIQQGGVTVEGDKISDPSAELAVRSGMVIRAGKRKWARIVVN